MKPTNSSKIPFNLPPILGSERAYLEEVLGHKKLSGDGSFNRRAASLLEHKTGSAKVILTPSCTSALEMAYLMIDLKPGDEVILPSFTFTSSATAIVLFGATPVFVDVDASLNVDVNKILAAVTPKTKAVCIVHYAGMCCDFDSLRAQLPQEVIIVEDAAQGVGAFYKDRPLGSLGDLGAFSFHETKNIVCGEGGALLVNRLEWVERAEILRDKGTNRQRFMRGEVDKYTWQDKGSSYLLPELAAAFLLGQLEGESQITEKRLLLWKTYRQTLQAIEGDNTFRLPTIPEFSRHNGHIFYLVLDKIETAVNLSDDLRRTGIQAVSHYVPLHNSPAGLRLGRAHGSVQRTEELAPRLLRLPMYFDLTISDVCRISERITRFFAEDT